MGEDRALDAGRRNRRKKPIIASSQNNWGRGKGSKGVKKRYRGRRRRAFDASRKKDFGSNNFRVQGETERGSERGYSKVIGYGGKHRLERGGGDKAAGQAFVLEIRASMGKRDGDDWKRPEKPSRVGRKRREYRRARVRMQNARPRLGRGRSRMRKSRPPDQSPYSGEGAPWDTLRR